MSLRIQLPDGGGIKLSVGMCRGESGLLLGHGGQPLVVDNLGDERWIFNDCQDGQRAAVLRTGSDGEDAFEFRCPTSCWLVWRLQGPEYVWSELR